MSVRFRYRAATADGQVVEGLVHAPSRQSVLEELRRQRLYPVTVDESTPAAAARVERRPRPPPARTPLDPNPPAPPTPGGPPAPAPPLPAPDPRSHRPRGDGPRG